MISKNTNKLLEILKGTNMTETPSLQNVKVKNERNEYISNIDTHPISAKAINCVYSLSETCKDVLAYVTRDNQLNVVVGTNKFISAKLPKKYLDIKICRFNEVFIFLRNDEGVKVYKTVDKKRLEEFAIIKYQLEEITMAERGTKFYCYINNEETYDIYCFTILGKRLENKIVTSIKSVATENERRLFVYEDACYFFTEDDKLININDKTDIIDGSAIYSFKKHQLVFKENVNNILITLLGTGFTYFVPRKENAKVKVFDELIIFYTNDDFILYRIDDSLQLERVHLLFDCTPKKNDNCELVICDKTLVFYAFCRDNKVDCPKSIPYEDLIARIDQIKYNPLNMHKMVTNESVQVDEKTKEPCDNNKELSKDDYEDLKEKIEKLIIDVEKQRTRNEEENKAKFLQLLEVVNNHLNENLVRGVENMIRKEVKIGIAQIKKSLLDNIQILEDKTDKVVCKVDELSMRQQSTGQAVSSADYIAAFKETMIDELLPIVESCFEEIRLQLLEGMNLKSVTNVVDNSERTISFKDEIANLLENSLANEAVLLVLDCDEPELLLYMIENLSIANIEKLNPHLQYLLIQKVFDFYKIANGENVVKCLCNLIVDLDINEIKQEDIPTLIRIFDEIIKIDWCEKTHMNLIIKMQRKQAMKKRLQ